MAAAMENEEISDFLKTFSNCTSKPELFLNTQNKVSEQFKITTKSVYDYTKNLEDQGVGVSEALPELITNQFDDEQVWQQLELQNNQLIAELLSNVAHVVTTKNKLNLNENVEDEEETLNSEDEESEDEEEGNSDEIDDFNDEENQAENESEEEKGLFDSDDDNDEASDEDLKELLEKSNRLGEDIDEDYEDNDEDDDTLFKFKDSENLAYDLDEDGDEDMEEEDDIENKTDADKTKIRTSVVDDQFFKLSEMEAFLEQEDAREERKRSGKKGKTADEESDEDEDMFDEGESDEDGKDLKYADFFDAPNEKQKKKVRFSQDAGDEAEQESHEDDDGNEAVEGSSRDLFQDSDSEGEDYMDILGGKRKVQKSSFEMRQEKLKKKIKEMEETNLTDKPWQELGETTATARPENSLLQEDLDFEHTTKLAPVITEETTVSLEAYIKQRIKDKAFDDVERKVKPKEQPYEYKKRVTLDQEKSKLSLGEVYEQEYLKQTQKEEEDQEDPDHEDIKKSMQALFLKLDALSNFHYTPKPALPEIKVVSNLPSVTVEEVAPVTASEATLLAPEEIQEKSRREVKGQTEKSDTDRKHERRKKKKLIKRLKIKEKEKKQKIVEKMNPGLGNKYSKKKAMDKLEKASKSSKNITLIKDDKSSKSGLTSSKEFFTKLQEEVKTQIQGRKGTKNEKVKAKAKSSAKLKL